MNEKYRTERMWIIPEKGTLGKKAENLLNNTNTILNHGWSIPRSMIIPYQYYSKEGGLYYMLDDISEKFGDCEFVAIRSNAPDEDREERTPGLYKSEKVAHKNRNTAIHQLASVIDSYNNPGAIQRRKRLGVQNEGMSLLVQEWIPPAFCGSFSDIGESGILLYADPTAGTESMTRPSERKLIVNQKGEIAMNSSRIFTLDQQLAKELRRITNCLPPLDKKGWELEFVINDNDKYILQTTPIKKQPRFEVRETVNNIFENRDVIGTGLFRTNGILYAPCMSEFNLRKFDETHKNYCLVSKSSMVLHNAESENPLNYVQNAGAFFCVSPSGGFEGMNSFASHVETFVRERGMCALVGRFTNELRGLMSGNEDDIKPVFVEKKLLIQTDEFDWKANVEIME